jgi:5'(3')-deoxyribonucleotidase
VWVQRVGVAACLGGMTANGVGLIVCASSMARVERAASATTIVGVRNKMIIAIDLDSTLNNLCHTWLAECNKRHNCNVCVDDILTWDTHLYVPCGKDIYKLLRPFLFRKCKPLDGAIEVTQRLVKKHTLLVVSAVAWGTFDVKKRWLQRYFPHLPTFITAHDKQYINCDYLIDDGPHNLEAVGLDKGIAFDYPYNRNWQGRRVYSWHDVEALLDDNQ